MDFNPYKPPAGNVDEVRVLLPLQIRYALSLFGLALMLNVPHVIHRFARVAPSDPFHYEKMIGTGIGLATMIVLAGLIFFAIWRAFRWGRVLYVLVVLLGSINAFTAIPVWFRRSAYLGTMDLLSTLADFAALALLFTPAANAFFRKR